MILADNISQKILQGELVTDDNLPSINEASDTYAVSRDTVFKAYKELKNRGLIDSNPMKGYFVKSEVNRVLLLLDTYSPFKQNLYNRLVGNLPANYQVDLLFHQYNRNLFETIIRESIGRYNHYVVMNFSNNKFSDVLKKIPEQKLLLLDFGAFDKLNYSYICQDFDESFYQCILSYQQQIKKYKRFILVFPESISHPVSSIGAFVRFCEHAGMDYSVYKKKSEWEGVQHGDVFLCIQPEDLVQIIKDADLKGYTPGVEVGVIAYNDSPMLDVIRNGITSMSIDFGLMGEMAAQFIVAKVPVRAYLPTLLINRNSV
jgi:DNA-binding transcriptional regulator YhcF (GntR family)